MKKTAVQVYIQVAQVSQANPVAEAAVAQEVAHQAAAPEGQKLHSHGDLSIQTIIQVNPPAEPGLN